MSMEGYPSMEGGQYAHDGYGGGSFGGQAESQGAAPFEGLGVEDNQLLWSVLSSTPVPEQYALAYPQSAPPNAGMWESHPGFGQHMGSFSGYPNQGVPSHMQAAMQAPRQQPMMHHSMSSQLHQSVSSSQAHMSGGMPPSQFGHQPVHNPFSIRNDSQNIVPVKHEGVVPLFTPNTAPYAATGGSNVNQNFAQPHLASHGAASATQQARLSSGPGTPPVQPKHSRAAAAVASAGLSSSGAGIPASQHTSTQQSPPPRGNSHNPHMSTLPIQQQQQQQQQPQQQHNLQQQQGGHFLRSQSQPTSHQQQQGGGAMMGAYSSPHSHSGSQDSPPSPSSAEENSLSPTSSTSGYNGMMGQTTQFGAKRGSLAGTASPSQNSTSAASAAAAAAAAAASMDDANSETDEFDDDTGPRNRRRESQNRASRNYRQRKKAYIKEMEAKLDALKLENEVLRTENQKSRRMLSQYQGDKPAPLIRSYSSELQDEEKEIEKLVSQLDSRANSQDATEEDLRILLQELHERMSNRQQLLNKEAIQLINPKMQERFARLEATPQHQLDEQMGQWLDQVAQFVSPEQIQRLAELKQSHLAARAAIWEERNEINNDIKQFYQEKVASERLNTPGRIDSIHLSALTHKLEALKKNLLREDELNAGSVDQFSSILTPHQEAIITVKHYSQYKDKLSAIHMLQNVWSALSKQDK